MKKTLLHLSILLVLAATMAQAQFTSVTNNGTITITGYTGTGGDLTIPATINGLPVTGIGDDAFFGSWDLTSVIIGNSVTSIGYEAFAECINLTNISILASVTCIGDFAFADSSLTSVTIPNSVTSIGDEAFKDCSSLTAIMVDTGNLFYSDLDGVLFNWDLTTLIQYPGGLVGSYLIPDFVTSIGDSAFEDAALTSLTIPNSVTDIGYRAFFYCTSLTSVTIGSNVTNISDYAFADCISLTSVYLAGNAPAVVNNFFSTGGGQPISDGSFIGDQDAPVIHYLPGTTGWSNTFAGYGNFSLPTALWLPQAQTGDGSFGVRSNQFSFNITWASGQTVVVEACTNLSNPDWLPVSTNTLVGGTSYFSDPQSPNLPRRFYRLRSP
jgi:BspA type Leucine rich repeat region (6 copies)